MSAIVRDLQDVKSPLNVVARDADEVLRILESGFGRAPFFCSLESSGYMLLVGVGENVGCVQHSSADRRPPYFMALSKDPEPRDDFCQFRSGGQPSDVPRRYCLSWARLRPIITFFAENGGSRDSRTEWEEI